MASTGAVMFKAGANCNWQTHDGLTSGARIAFAVDEAESYINTNTRINYTDTFSTLNADVKAILQDTCACHAAITLINYDQSGYTSRQEALTMINILWGKMMENIRLLREKKNTDFINAA